MAMLPTSALDCDEARADQRSRDLATSAVSSYVSRVSRVQPYRGGTCGGTARRRLLLIVVVDARLAADKLAILTRDASEQ